jgi:hypothetical protein
MVFEIEAALRFERTNLVYVTLFYYHYDTHENINHHKENAE